jgi:hypothetical protein
VPTQNIECILLANQRCLTAFRRAGWQGCAMKPTTVCAALFCLAVPAAAQADVYKCVIRHHVTYQDHPCPNADEEELVISSLKTDRTDPEPQAPAATASDVLPEPPPGLATDSPGLLLGMFDTQVLNLRGWGRPAKITRSKARGAWREHWTYYSPNAGERRLHFANGRLAAIGDEASF